MKRIALTIMTALALIAGPALSAGTVYATASCSGSGNGTDAAKKQVLTGVVQAGDSCDSSGVNNAVATAVDILSMIVGIVSVIAIISGGFKYVTSGGDAAKVGNAKNTIIYALVGIVVVVLAQLIVRFVITQANDAVKNPPNTPATSAVCPAGHQSLLPTGTACLPTQFEAA